MGRCPSTPAPRGPAPACSDSTCPSLQPHLNKEEGLGLPWTHLLPPQSFLELPPARRSWDSHPARAGTPIPSSPGPPPGTTERGERHLQPHTWFRAISSILQPSPRGALPCLCTTEVPCLFSISTGSLKLWFLPTALCPFALCCRETRCDLLLKALPQAHRAHLTQHSLLPFL